MTVSLTEVINYSMMLQNAQHETMLCLMVGTSIIFWLFFMQSIYLE